MPPGRARTGRPVPWPGGDGSGGGPHGVGRGVRRESGQGSGQGELRRARRRGAGAAPRAGHSWVGWRSVRPYCLAIAFHSRAALPFSTVAVPLARLPARVCPVVRAWPFLQPRLPAV